MRRLQIALGFALAFALSCNDHVFNVVEPRCHAEQAQLKDAEITKPVDILVVVDNSGSMCEEQAALKESFLDPDCVDFIPDINNPPAEFINPTPDQVDVLQEKCGFIQILSLFEATDWRLGVITTDVSACDNAAQQASNPDLLPLNCFGQVFPDRARHPQRGCLQPPAFDGGRKFLQLGDEDLGNEFNSILDNVQTWGSGFERGLDATTAFLNADVAAPECASDRDDFLRRDATLAIIYLTDEDDCSHGDNFVDENSSITCTQGVREAFDPAARSRDCYERRDELTPVSEFNSFLSNIKGVGRDNDVKVAVIGGALDLGDGPVAASCSNDNNTPSGQCTPSFGNSNNPSVCDANSNCCEADGSNRYFEFAGTFGDNGFVNSICTDFRETMIRIAEFIGRVEEIQLVKEPPNPQEIVVRVVRADGSEEFLARIPDGAGTDGEDGFQYNSNALLISFFGSSAPQPGDRVSVHYASNPLEDPCN